MQATQISLPSDEGFIGNAKLYYLDTPVKYYVPRQEDPRKTHYVVASATSTLLAGPETLVYPATEEGQILDWGVVGGGPDFLDPDKAVRDMGYSVQVLEEEAA